MLSIILNIGMPKVNKKRELKQAKLYAFPLICSSIAFFSIETQ